MDNRINDIENQIKAIKEEIESENFEKSLSIQIDSITYRKQINQKISEAILIVKDKYPVALEPLSFFVKLIVKMLNNYEKHLRVKAKIQYYNILKNNYKDFCYNEYGELIAKINSALKQLESIKKEELTKNICPEHVKLFNLLNDEEYTNYSDVIDYVLSNEIDHEIQEVIVRKIEKITGDDLIIIQQVVFLNDDLKSCKQLLKQKKKENHRGIQQLNETIQSLKNKDWYLWPSYPKKTNNLSNEEYEKRKINYEKNIFSIIEKYVKSLDEVSLSLIVAFCAQINFFDVTYVDSVSGKSEKFIIKSAKKESFTNYIIYWKRSFKNYLDMNIGGIN